MSHATQRVHSTALHRLLLHQPGRCARVLQQLPSVKQYGAMPTGSQYCLVCSGFGMHVYRVGDKRILSRATQRVHSTALHRLLLYQPGRRARVHVHKHKLEAGEPAAVGLNLSGLSLTRSETCLGDGRAKDHSLLPPPERPEARQLGRRTRPRARTWRAPSAPAAEHQPDPPCGAPASATARRTESPDRIDRAERASSWRTPPHPRLEPAQPTTTTC